jgi:DNA polymerase-3 subunit beta
MKAICHREGLLSAVQLASVALPARDVAKAILKNLKVVADDGRCTLMATDLELGIRLDVRGLTVQEPGEAVVPASRLLDILRTTTDEELAIEADASACVVRGRQAEFEMPSEDPAPFPDLPTFAEENYHELPAGTLREMVRRTLFAAADSEASRFVTTGVLWELDGDTARLVATDGKRLALAQGAATGRGEHGTRGTAPVVPAKAMSLLERNLQDDDELVCVSLRANEALFRTERAIVYSRLLDGRFPPYRDAFPKKPAVKVPLPVAPFLAAVRQAAIMTDDESKRVTFAFGKGRLILEAQGKTTGRSKVEMPLEYDGKAVTINFDPKFLIDMLRVLPADADLLLELVDGNSPALFRQGGDYSYLVMPLT